LARPEEKGPFQEFHAMLSHLLTNRGEPLRELLPERGEPLRHLDAQFGGFLGQPPLESIREDANHVSRPFLGEFVQMLDEAVGGFIAETVAKAWW
jgi:hypothetical protein